jgi:hypothetical protein
LGELGGEAGCDGLCPLGRSVLPDGLTVVFIPPVAPVAPPAPVPVVAPEVPDETLPVPADAPPEAEPPPAPPAPCAKAAVDDRASANPKVIVVSFMTFSFVS